MGEQGGKWRGAGVAALVSAAFALPLTAGFAGAAAPIARGPSLRVTHVRPSRPDPLAVTRYLEAQRAGFGPPRRAAALAAHAAARARAIRARPRSAPPGVAPAASAFSGGWEALGPAPVTTSFYGGPNSGRVDSVAVVQSGEDKGEVFIGTAGGGVWSSKDDGASWVTHTDQAATGLAIGALAIDPAEPKTIYAGTGEANGCADCFYGGGVLKSTNGGETWAVENPGGAFTGADFASLAVDPHNPEIVYAGTTYGFYISKNGGTSWAQPETTKGYANGSAYGVALDPATNPTTVYVAIKGVGIEKSTNGGETFTTLAGLPAAEHFGAAQIGIGTKSAGHETANEDLYAAVQLEGEADANGGDLSLFKSTNGGTSWSRLAIPAYANPAYAYEEKPAGAGDQAYYDNTIAVDPANPEHVLAAGIAFVESTNGGTSWTNVEGHDFDAGGNVIHPDFHALEFATATGAGVSAGEALVGCDGGIYRYNPAQAGPTGVADLNKAGSKLDTTQLYADISVNEDGARILGGLQDNGTAYYTGTEGWPDVLAGDGGYNAINPLDREQQFAQADQHLYETIDGWTESRELQIAAGNEGMNGNFVSPLAIIPNASEHEAPIVLYGGADLWATTNPTAPTPTWRKLTTVGTANSTKVSAIAIAPSDHEVMYVGFDDGKLLVSTDATAPIPTFTEISPGPAEWITHIEVSPSSPGSIALTFSSSNDQSEAVAPMVETGAVTLTGTPSATYSNITGDLPSGVASNSVVSDAGDLLVATDVGVFSTANPNGASTAWSAVGTGLPNVQVLGLSVDEAGNVYAATHGRGLWRLPFPVAPKNTAAPTISGEAIEGKTLTAHPGTWEHNPASYEYQWLRCDTAGASCTPIGGATEAAYKLIAADVEHTIRVEVIAQNAGGEGKATSEASATVTAPAATTTTTATATTATASTAHSPPSVVTTSTTTTVTSATVTPQPAAGTAVAGGTASVSADTATISLRCAGAGACAGTLQLSVMVAGRRRVVKRHGRRLVVRSTRTVAIGRARFALAPGGHELLRVRLTASGKRMAARAGRRGLRAHVTGAGVRATTVVLRRARKPRSRRGRARRAGIVRAQAIDVQLRDSTLSIIGV